MTVPVPVGATYLWPRCLTRSPTRTTCWYMTSASVVPGDGRISLCKVLLLLDVAILYNNKLRKTIKKTPILKSGMITMAGPTGFEPAISSVTGRHVRPLHHGPAYNQDILPDLLERGNQYTDEGILSYKYIYLHTKFIEDTFSALMTTIFIQCVEYTISSYLTLAQHG